MLAQETRVTSVFRAFRDLLAASARPRRRGKVSPAAELCEQRCLPAPLGAVPSLDYPAAGRDAITGFVSDSSDGNFFTVEVDLHDDGTVDYTLTTQYDPFLNLYGFRHEFDSTEIPQTAFNVRLTPVERNSFGERQVGLSSVHTVAESRTDVPRLVMLGATRIHLYGVVNHFRIGYGGRYDVEVAVGSPTSTFSKWGETEVDGTFFLDNRAPLNVGMIDLYVRIRETSGAQSLLSSVSKLTYDTNPPVPPPGYVDPSFMSMGVAPQATADSEALPPLPGHDLDEMLASDGSTDADMLLAAETSQATDLVFSEILPGDAEDSWLSLLI